MQESLSPAAQQISHLPFSYNLTVWGVQPLVTHQTSWLESTGVSGNRQSAIQQLCKAQQDSEFECQLMPISMAAGANIEHRSAWSCCQDTPTYSGVMCGQPGDARGCVTTVGLWRCMSQSLSDCESHCLGHTSCAAMALQWQLHAHLFLAIKAAI